MVTVVVKQGYDLAAKTVLVVEDEQKIPRWLQAYFEQAGFDVLRSPDEQIIIDDSGQIEEIERLQRLVEDLRQLSLADAGVVSLKLG